jgi:hypothetical protein
MAQVRLLVGYPACRRAITARKCTADTPDRLQVDTARPHGIVKTGL